MSEHTPTPWKVVSTPNFENGYVYTSIQPVIPDADAMRHLMMANGEFHVCRMTHTAAMHKAELHRANAAFIVRAVNSHDELVAALKALSAAVFGPNDARSPRLETAIEMTIAALTKATGAS